MSRPRLRPTGCRCAAGPLNWRGAGTAAPIPVRAAGNIFDVFPVQDGAKLRYVPLKTFLTRRLFPERSFLLFYDIGGGLTFGSAEMQKRFFEWLEIFDQVEKTNFHQQGPPREFNRLAPLLRRFFLRAAEDKGG